VSEAEEQASENDGEQKSLSNAEENQTNVEKEE